MTHYAPVGYNEASGSFYPPGHLLGLPGTRPPSISADLTWIPAHILDGPLRARWIQRGFWLVLSAQTPLGHLLGLPGTRPPSVSADLTWFPAHTQ